MENYKSLQTNPFQKSGKLKKKNNYDKSGKIFTTHNFAGGVKIVPVMKENGEQWSKIDKPHVSLFEQEVVLEQISNLNLKKLLKACDILKVTKWGKSRSGTEVKLNNDQLISSLKKAYTKEKSNYVQQKFEKFIMHDKNM